MNTYSNNVVEAGKEVMDIIKKISDNAIITQHEMDCYREEHQKLLTLFKIVSNTPYDVLYISDVNTHQLIYVNPTTVKTLGSYHGKKCYEYFHDRTSPCDFCNNKELLGNKGDPRKWAFFNKKIGRLYHIVDVVDDDGHGNTLRCERAVDITNEIKCIVEIANKYNLL